MSTRGPRTGSTVLRSITTGCKHANDRPSRAFEGPGAVFACSQPCAAPQGSSFWATARRPRRSAPPLRGRPPPRVPEREGRASPKIQPKERRLKPDNPAKTGFPATSQALSTTVIYPPAHPHLCTKPHIYSANEAVENRNRSRRTYGIAEVVNCCCTPTLSGANWTAVDAGLFYAANLYSCPYYETNCRLRLTVGNVCNDFEISVIEPQDVMCQNAAMIDYSTPKGTAGYFGLALSGITLLPRTVCFGNIFVEEIPTDEGTRTGYFTNPFFSDCWSHSYAQGAGIWIGVDGNNELDTVDQATCGAVPPPWSSGGMVWPIPMGFHVEQAALGTPPIGEINANVSSVYTLMSSGKAILSKLGHWVSRNTNDVIVVDGIVVKGED